MMNLRNFTFSILFLTLSTFGNSQETYRVQHRYNKVIAKTGLNLRSQPTVKSKMITKLPFGVEVAFVDEKSYGLDTLQMVEDKQLRTAIIGHWVKVSYKGDIGYVNNAYLFMNESFRDRDQDAHYYSSDYVFMEYQRTCYDNLYDLRRYKWYGYYSSDCTLRRISVSYGRNVLDMEQMSVIVDDDEGLDWIVGTKGQLDTGPLDYLVRDFYFYRSIPYDNQTEQYRDYTEPYFDVTSATINEQNGFDIRIKAGGKSQIIMDAVNDSDLKGIKWMGDLDRDGKMDYIIMYGEKSYRSFLYLSSHGGGGILVKPVARFMNGYCC